MQRCAFEALKQNSLLKQRILFIMSRAERGIRRELIKHSFKQIQQMQHLKEYQIVKGRERASDIMRLMIARHSNQRYYQGFMQFKQNAKKLRNRDWVLRKILQNRDAIKRRDAFLHW